MLELLQIDAFTDQPFAGNPAAVCFLDGPRPDEWLAAVAREMNLSETAFLLPEGDGWLLRWFTPAVEVKLCGHATLASAHALWGTGRLRPEETARFHTLSGLLTARRRGEEIELDFPCHDVQPAEPSPGLTEALGLTSPPCCVGRYGEDFLLELESEAAVLALAPDFRRLGALEPRVRGVSVTARASRPDADCVSRFFAPAAGVDEDPVTGSAHCGIGPYWLEKLGKDSVRAYQASARGGWLTIRREADRCLLAGRAVTVLSGRLAATADSGPPQ
ncbi:MAG TPA: PhzF family phenazine biosynthesis protein [Thermoanaerobaculia bacterium]|nr:PhzF family phenazine biosynthesis protein [Thermoanaerobaculia bacterium]